jgi:hypothetical protein
VRVVVVAAPALATEPAGGDHPRLDRVRPPARLAERQRGERLRHLEPGVDPDQVHQLERPHPEAAAEPVDAVDRRMVGDPLLEATQRLGGEGPAAAVDEEARPVGGEDDVLAHRRADLAGEPERAVAGLIGADQLEQPHQRRRIEEVHPDNVLWPLRRARKRCYRDRRRVGREDRVAAADLRQLGEQLALELEPLRRRLDREVAACEPVERGRGGQQVRRVGPDAALLGPARESLPHVFDTALQRLGQRIVEDRREAGRAAELRDPRSHRSCTDDPQHHRQETTASCPRARTRAGTPRTSACAPPRRRGSPSPCRR